ncbi:hypothetical protein [Frondihabitans australicus]|uniref:Excisionase family DNA binding protein n=1 Tax=Frondihabitans australicus TaxID=386892 RepID=A0A495IG89_9MICO|nr:hypothetical protein [Frondihabitans australicus]RKR74759.1 excisionase family DNA binding protein [Frondihabitans australicus]
MAESVCGTMSVDEMSGYLGVDDEELRRMVEEGQLPAVVIADRIRFPSWQCNIGSYVKLLPGLPEVIAALTEDEAGWQIDAGFMSVPKASLFAEGRQTPVEWLRDGHSPERVVELIRDRDLW